MSTSKPVDLGQVAYEAYHLREGGILGITCAAWADIPAGYQGLWRTGGMAVRKALDEHGPYDPSHGDGCQVCCS